MILCLLLLGFCLCWFETAVLLEWLARGRTAVYVCGVLFLQPTTPPAEVFKDRRLGAVLDTFSPSASSSAAVYKDCPVVLFRPVFPVCFPAEVYKDRPFDAVLDTIVRDGYEQRRCGQYWQLYCRACACAVLTLF